MATILLADDNRFVRRMLRARLEDLCSDIVEASDGQAALDLARVEHPQVAVLDFEMPILTGLEVCTRLKAESATRDIKVFILTGSTDEDIESHAMDVGVDAFFSKAQGTEPICQAIARELSRKVF